MPWPARRGLPPAKPSSLQSHIGLGPAPKPIHFQKPLHEIYTHQAVNNLMEIKRPLYSA